LLLGGGDGIYRADLREMRVVGGDVRCDMCSFTSSYADWEAYCLTRCSLPLRGKCVLHTSIIESEAVFGELSIAIERWAVRVMIRQGEREEMYHHGSVCDTYGSFTLPLRD